MNMSRITTSTDDEVYSTVPSWTTLNVLVLRKRGFLMDCNLIPQTACMLVACNFVHFATSNRCCRASHER